VIDLVWIGLDVVVAVVDEIGIRSGDSDSGDNDDDGLVDVDDAQQRSEWFEIDQLNAPVACCSYLAHQHTNTHT